MLDLQACKFVSVVPPISVAGGANATVVNVIDTKGFRAAALTVSAGLTGANGVTVIQWQESHEASGANAVNITGASHTALVDANDNVSVRTFINLLGNRRRYITLLMTVGSTNACLLSAHADLYRGEEAPNTAAERGLLEQKFV
jgi:hypothetical protein